MADLQVTYTGSGKACCGSLPSEVILLVDPTKLAPVDCVDADETYDTTYIEASLISQKAWNPSWGCGENLFQMEFTYDDSVLLDTEDPLVTADILGVLCKDVFTEWVEDIVGGEVTLSSEAGVITLTSQHGCTYTFTPSFILSLQDTNSIDLSFPVANTLKADLIVDPVAGNQIQVNANGVSVLTDGLVWCGTAGGTKNAILLTHPNPPGSLVPGMEVSFIAAFDNDAATTLEISGVGGSLAINDWLDAVQLNINDIRAGGVYKALYTGTNWILLTHLPDFRSMWGLNDSSDVTKNSATVTVMGSTAFTLDVVSGDRIELDAQISLSTGDITAVGLFEFYENGVAMSFAKDVKYTGAVSVTGNDIVVPLFISKVTALTGTITYDLRWSRSSGSGTLYSTSRYVRGRAVRRFL